MGETELVLFRLGGTQKPRTYMETAIAYTCGLKKRPLPSKRQIWIRPYNLVFESWCFAGGASKIDVHSGSVSDCKLNNNFVRIDWEGTRVFQRCLGHDTYITYDDAHVVRINETVRGYNYLIAVRPPLYPVNAGETLSASTAQNQTTL